VRKNRFLFREQQMISQKNRRNWRYLSNNPPFDAVFAIVLTLFKKVYCARNALEQGGHTNYELIRAAALGESVAG
jgi:hypothetical protein